MSRQTLTKKADRVFSIYIRSRGSTFEYNHCYTCGKYLPIIELQAGHFIPRRYMNTRWHPLNVWPQCNHCNVELSGNLTKYENKLVAQYSSLAIEALWDLARSDNPITETDIRSVIKQYK